MNNSNSTAYTILSKPPATAPDFILLSIVLSFLFCVGYISVCVHHARNDTRNDTRKTPPFDDVYVATIGVLSFLTGMHMALYIHNSQV